MATTAAKRDDSTVPHTSIPLKVLTQARKKLNEIHPDGKVHPDTIVTVLKATIERNSPIVGVPRKIEIPGLGVTFRIPLRNYDRPAFATMQQILGT